MEPGVEKPPAGRRPRSPRNPVDLELGCGAGRVTTTLQQDYFGLDTVDESGGATSYQLTYGDWIRVLRGAGLVVDDLIEPRPDPGTANGYNRTDPPDWAHRWPAESLWVTRKP